MVENKKNDALEAEVKYKTAIEEAYDYIENFDILETITNVGNDEIFTPRKTANMMLDSLPEEVWHDPTLKWLNPASKNGVFEREIAIRLDDGLKSKIPDEEKRRKHILQNMIYSYGLTKFTANVARRTLYYCCQANRKCDGKKATDGHYINGYAIGNGGWFDDEEGNIKTPNSKHDFVDTRNSSMPNNCSKDAKKKYHCKYCGISGASSYNDMNQRENYAYEFIHVYHLGHLRYLQNRFFKGDRNMKFDIIIGNPPYSLGYGIEGGNSSNSESVYHKFIAQAIKLFPKYVCMITPSRWMTKTSQGIEDEWVDEMLKDHHIKIMHDFNDAIACFPPTIELKGGASYFVWQSDYNGKCDYYYHDIKNDVINHRFDYLDPINAGIVIRDPKSFSIIKKIIEKEGDYFKENNFRKLVSPKHFYDDSTLLTSNWKDYSERRTEKSHIKYYVSKSTHGTSFGWVSENQIPKHKETISLHKIYIPTTGGSGNDSQVIGKPFYGEPNSICSQTYLVIGWDKKTNNYSKKICDNIIKYMYTKFFRYLVSVKKKTQNCPRDMYQFVPLVDFNKEWTDEELYKLYNLSDKDVSLIESSIKELI